MFKKYYIIFIVLVFVVLVALLALTRQPAPPAEGKISVAASFYPVYHFSQAIGGDRAEVVNLTPYGAEPHDYEPTPRDIARVENSRLLVLNGGGLEAWASDIKQNIDPQKTLVVTAGEGLGDRQSTEGGQPAIDPHFWLSPPLAKLMADKIADGFSQIDPANQDYYRSNAQALKDKLDALDQVYRQGLSACAQKSIITSHAAFGYLAAAYGLSQVPIAGLSPEAEPSPRQLADIAAFAADNGVKYIFFESLASPKLSQAIAAEVGAQTLVLNPLEGLSREELSQGEDYFTVMRKNLINLCLALQCSD